MSNATRPEQSGLAVADDELALAIPGPIAKRSFSMSNGPDFSHGGEFVDWGNESSTLDEHFPCASSTSPS